MNQPRGIEVRTFNRVIHKHAELLKKTPFTHAMMRVFNVLAKLDIVEVKSQIPDAELADATGNFLEGVKYLDNWWSGHVMGAVDMNTRLSCEEVQKILGHLENYAPLQSVREDIEKLITPRGRIQRHKALLHNIATTS